MTPQQEELARRRAHDVLGLMDRWSDFYSVGWDWQTDQYCAVRRDTYERIVSPTVLGLTTLLEHDLSERPVKRAIY